MQEFQVWAPRARSVKAHLLHDGVECQFGAELTPEQTKKIVELKSSDSGIWYSPEPLLHTAGTRYFMQVDDGLLIPDARSRRQPFGIHGPSEIVDPRNFPWTDDTWVSEDASGKVFYELHIGTFTAEGTYLAAIEKLDYLVDLGVEVVELMPLNPVPGERGWGYDGVSIMATYEPYGSPAELAALINAMHARGLHACIDVVYNHFGPDGNYLGMYGPYLTDKHETPWGQAVNLDGPDSQHVRRYFIDNILQWARDFHFDVFRMDAVDQLKDDSQHHIISEISQELASLGEKLGKRLTLTVESDANNVRMVTPTSLGGRGADMQWTDDVHHGLHVWLTGEANAYYSEYTKPGTLEKVLTNGFYHDGIWSDFDAKIRGAKVPAEISGHCFIVCDENHDQVGNRLIGDRPSATLPLADLAISRTLILLSAFTPMLFMGEEWATQNAFPFFTDHGPEIGAKILDGRMNEFAGWDFGAISAAANGQLQMPDPQAQSTFEAAKLKWSEREIAPHSNFFEFVKTLIALRKASPDLHSGDRSLTTVRIAERHGWMRRGDVVIVFSRDADIEVFLPDQGNLGNLSSRQIWTSWGDLELTKNNSAVYFSMPGVAVIGLDGSPL